MQTFRIRASATSDIMGYPDKAEVPAGAITYLKKWVKEQLYSKKKEFTSKYTDKGTQAEPEAIEFASDYFQWGMVEKNEERFFNDFAEGTPDIILNLSIEDLKCSWDCFTFPLFDEKVDLGYWWQLQTYMWLTGKEKAGLIYSLMDAPDNIIEQEAKRLSAKNGLDEIDLEIWEQVKESMTYSHLPDHLRIKRYEIARDDKAIEQIETRVKACRVYIDKHLSPNFKSLLVVA
jgi:hypothetical protein